MERWFTSGSVGRFGSMPDLHGLNRILFDIAGHQRSLDFGNRLRHFDIAWTGRGAVEDRPASPDAFGVVEDVQSLGGSSVSRIEDEAVGVDDRGGANVLSVAPEWRAGRGAAGAEDALGRVVEPRSFGR